MHMSRSSKRDTWLFALLGWDPTFERRLSRLAYVAWTVAVVCVWIAVGGLTLLALYFMPVRYRWVPLVLVAFAWVTFSAIQVVVRRQLLERIDAEDDQRAARRIQARLLPSSLPTVSGLELAAHYSPYREVGGDYYDAVALDDTRVLVTVADVSGKGTGAALLTANFQALLHFSHDREAHLDAVADAINRHLVHHTDDSRFITMVLAVADLRNGRLRYVNAGHNPPLGIDAAGRPLRLDATGLPLGMLDAIPYTTGEVPLLRGTRLLLYTDGLTEHRNKRDEMFGEDGVLTALQSKPDGTAGEIVTATVDAVTRFARGTAADDDMTLLGLRVT
jgi:sigma-B regulation protein RsbU (phosphoserine phosphatase)